MPLQQVHRTCYQSFIESSHFHVFESLHISVYRYVSSSLVSINPSNSIDIIIYIAAIRNSPFNFDYLVDPKSSEVVCPSHYIMPSATSAPAPTAVGNHSVTAKKPNPGPTVPLPRHVKVGVWGLRSTEFTEIEAPENTESLFSGNAGESVIGEDNRKRVNKKDFMPGGKYRC